MFSKRLTALLEGIDSGAAIITSEFLCFVIGHRDCNLRPLHLIGQAFGGMWWIHILQHEITKFPLNGMHGGSICHFHTFSLNTEGQRSAN